MLTSTIHKKRHFLFCGTLSKLQNFWCYTHLIFLKILGDMYNILVYAQVKFEINWLVNGGIMIKWRGVALEVLLSVYE